MRQATAVRTTRR